MKQIKLSDMYKYKVNKLKHFICNFKVSTEYFSIHKYIKNADCDRYKGRSFPNLRGTWLPSLDRQAWGWAINWLGIRIRLGS